MSKKHVDTFQTKITRNDRFAQMSHQEKLIEQKKREIQAKLEAKEKTKVDASKVKTETPPKSSPKSDLEQRNAFSNDGSFLDQFKQLKEVKKSDSKLRSFSKSKERFSDDRNKPNSRWGPRRRSPSPKDVPPKRASRFSNEKMSSFEPKITISTAFTNSLVQQQPPPPPPPPPPSSAPLKTEEVTGQPLLKNDKPQGLTFPQPANSDGILTASPLLLNVQATHVLHSDIGTASFISAPLFTTVNLPLVAPVPPPVELAAIPPPNPIQVQNIPQPAPMQVQNIPTPGALHLNQIPNPRPLDLTAIPTPSDRDFLKNVPPPNKAVPPPPMDFPPPMGGGPIPSLMAQPVLPPPGLSLNINVSCPPPSMFVGQPAGSLGRLPSMNVPPPTGGQIMDGFGDMSAGTAEFESMASLGRMVAECGNSIEDIVRQRKTQDPHLWFLFHKESAAYGQYRRLIEQFKAETEQRRRGEAEPKTEDDYEPYEPEMALEDRYEEDFQEGKVAVKVEEEDNAQERRRKRKSRWGEKEGNIPPPSILMYNTAPTPTAHPPAIPTIIPQTNAIRAPVMLSKVGRSDPGLLQYAVNTYGSTSLSEEEWKKVEDHYKISLLYQDMLRKREEVERLQMAGKNKYEYDSDEDTDGGTWEHKARDKEMMATELWAQELNRQAEGKHHIGDFLPPDELKRFMEKSTAVREGREPNLSDYKEFKIKEDNVGFRMLQKLGWTEGEGLGSGGMGIVEPVNKAPPRENTQGLGLNFNQPEEDEDEYESYRKRMMLAYRFRPNPLNNPRRPYY